MKLIIVNVLLLALGAWGAFSLVTTGRNHEVLVFCCGALTVNLGYSVLMYISERRKSQKEVQKVIQQLGENLYKVNVSWRTWSPAKVLVRAILELQARGKTITDTRFISSLFAADYYLICTM